MAGDWRPCDQCGGACIADATSCLAHAGTAERAAALKQFSESGDLDLRGATISEALLKEIFDAVPRNADGHRTFSAAQFDGATFKGDANFSGAILKADANFSGAIFEADAVFIGAIFEEGDSGHEAVFVDGARFGGATFKGDAQFEKAKFEGGAWFEKAKFEGGSAFVEAAFAVAEFGGARFEGLIWFYDADFGGSAGFEGAIFEGDPGFARATFKSYANFDDAIFEGNAEFGDAIFSAAWFEKTRFEGDAQFGEAIFEGYSKFEGAIFEGNAEFGGAKFKGDARFPGAKFKGDARFGGAKFKGDARFGGAKFDGDAEFSGAKFEGDVPMLGPVAVGGRLGLDGVQFASVVRIETDANELTCRRSGFPGGVRFDVRRASIRLDESDFSMPSLLTGPPASSPAEAERWPKLFSLQGANVAGLTLGNVDVAGCRFAGAHNLDKLRLEAGTAFGLSPAVWVWEQRQVVAEEAVWRAARTRRSSWLFAPWLFAPWSDLVNLQKPLNPGAIADLYRALRKSREDGKDEPGAADFYYGEMEMRRYDRGPSGANRWRGRASRTVLTAYWLVSGYGLRAWRSLAALTVVTALFAVAFHYIGFTKPPEPVSYWTSLLYAFRSTISLTDSQVILTAWGSFFQALLRITGPVLLGLTLLALRSRVKR